MDYARKYIQRLDEIFCLNKQNFSDGEERINVHAAVSRFAFFYEKIRNLVDYKDEHLIRKAAVLRILKRLLILEQDPRSIAEQLIRELIAARYLPNGQIPVSLVDDISWRVYKLQLVQHVAAGDDRHLDWIRAMVSVEIEEALVAAEREKALINFLFDRIRQSVRVTRADINDTDLQLQLYIACFRALYKADDEIVGFKLLRAFLPEWMAPQSWMDNPRPVAERLLAVERRINLQLHHPLSQRFQRAVKPWAVALGMLNEVLVSKPDEAHVILGKRETMRAAVSYAADERYASTKTRVRRATVRAMVYLFATKMLLALVLEAPIEWTLYRNIHIPALLVNLLFPATLMFVVGLMIRVPGTDNTDKILTGLDELMGESLPAPLTIVAPARRTALAKAVLGITYFLTFVVTFGGIVLILEYLSFTWISTLIFLFFLCLVSFFAYRIRMSAREFTVIDTKVTLWTSVVDFFSIPVLRAGRWLSRNINRINVFLFFFDFIFEAPYKYFLSLLEEWFAFAKEKKDELQP